MTDAGPLIIIHQLDIRVPMLQVLSGMRSHGVFSVPASEGQVPLPVGKLIHILRIITGRDLSMEPVEGGILPDAQVPAVGKSRFFFGRIRQLIDRKVVISRNTGCLITFQFPAAYGAVHRSVYFRNFQHLLLVLHRDKTPELYRYAPVIFICVDKISVIPFVGGLIGAAFSKGLPIGQRVQILCGLILLPGAPRGTAGCFILRCFRLLQGGGKRTVGKGHRFESPRYLFVSFLRDLIQQVIRAVEARDLKIHVFIPGSRLLKDARLSDKFLRIRIQNAPAV